MNTLLAADRHWDRPELARMLGAARSEIWVVAVMLAGAGLAWWSTADRIAGMDAGPGSRLGGFGWFTGAWVVMLAAVMQPSLAPTAAAYAMLTRPRVPSRSLAFVAGYLLVWTAVGAAAYGLFALGTAAFGSALAWQAGGRWLAAVMLGLAAAYQLTPLKRACLRACRRPTALSALGVMSVTWMALIAALVAVEKLGPWERAATAATAVILAVLAVAILAAPYAVPGWSSRRAFDDGDGVSHERS